jgi:hypothetical protein
MEGERSRARAGTLWPGGLFGNKAHPPGYVREKALAILCNYFSRRNNKNK